ncbi:MAG: hypothetical protein H7Z39_01030 [Burkholderiaceae bacterium]|nr:hypothetical protein [Burkholderiaceae bacterium]
MLDSRIDRRRRGSAGRGAIGGLTLPVIAMTAGVLESERERCIAAGISDFIAKPVVIEDMLEVIERQLGKTGAPPGGAG